MNDLSLATARGAVPLPLVHPAAVDPAFASHQAALLLLPHLEHGEHIDAGILRAAMVTVSTGAAN